MGWSGKRCMSMEACLRDTAVGPQLQVVGGGAAPTELLLHVALAPRPACARATHWTFYEDLEEITQCAFLIDRYGVKSQSQYFEHNYRDISNTIENVVIIEKQSFLLW
jgi:hypothetical protein